MIRQNIQKAENAAREKGAKFLGEATPTMEGMIRHALLADSIPIDETEFTIRAIKAYDPMRDALVSILAINGSSGGPAALVKEFKNMAAIALGKAGLATCGHDQEVCADGICEEALRREDAEAVRS